MSGVALARQILVGVVLAGFVASVAACEPAPQATVPVEGVAPVECVGIPDSTCREVVANARANARPGSFPVTIRAVCAQAACTHASGEVTVEVLYSDGRRESSVMGWAGPAIPGGDPGEPAPDLAVAPICHGVPAVQCRDMALAATDEGPPGSRVLSIVVRCTQPPCTAETGDGDTVVTFSEGTRRESSWSYRN